LRPRAFDYYAASTVQEAAKLLKSKEDARVLAGGLSLVPMMKLRIASPKTIIDINRIADLNLVCEERGAIRIGALVRHDQIEHSPLIRSKQPLLAEAASFIGDQQIRNRGTIGGSIAQADPAADLSPALVASKATVKTVGPSNQRSIESNEFFKDAYTTCLEIDEVISEVQVPVNPPGTGEAYVKLAGKTSEWSVVNVAVSLQIANNVCKDVVVVLGSVTTTPTHAVQTENALLGKKPDDQSIDSAALLALNGLESRPTGSLTKYRTHITKVMVKRALQEALRRAVG
jgi:carbon-monoxide dehydrogenase medium subunit